MIEIFKTTVQSAADADVLLALLRGENSSLEVNFDLEYCDNILRVKGAQFCIPAIMQLLVSRGFECSLLN